jgi:hypothetical protein
LAEYSIIQLSVLSVLQGTLDQHHALFDFLACLFRREFRELQEFHFSSTNTRAQLFLAMQPPKVVDTLVATNTAQQKVGSFLSAS